jgi:tight adherence protein C
MPTALEPFSGEGGIVGLTALTAFLTVAALWYALFERDSAAIRARILERRRAELEGRTAGRQRGRRRRQLTAIATSLVDRLRLAQANGIEGIREQLSAAGLRGKEAVALYLFASLCAPVVAVVIALVLTSGTHAGFASAMMYLAIAGLSGLLAPRWYVRWRLSRRLSRLRRVLPDALDLLVICAEAGLSLDAALHRVARELGRASPELADELALTAVELTFLPERRQALRNFARRVPLPAANALVGTLVQTERYGTPLAPSLRVLANELREQRLIRAEEKAARLPAILTVPLIVFILPTLFVVLAGPAFIDIYDQLVNR